MKALNPSPQPMPVLALTHPTMIAKIRRAAAFAHLSPGFKGSIHNKKGKLVATVTKTNGEYIFLNPEGQDITQTVYAGIRAFNLAQRSLQDV